MSFSVVSLARVVFVCAKGGWVVIFCICRFITDTFCSYSGTHDLCWRLAVWLSGNALASINVVALRQTRLVLGWVTVCGRVNHFGM